MGLPSGRVALAGRGSRQPHSQGGGCSASPLLSEGRQPLSPGLNQPFPKGLYNVLYRSLKPPRLETDQSSGIIRLFGNRRRFLLRSPGPRRAHSRRQRVRSGSPNSPSCLSPIRLSGRLQNTHRGTGSPTKGATGPGLAIRQRCGDRSPVRLSRDAHRGQAWANLFPRPSWRST